MLTSPVAGMNITANQKLTKCLFLSCEALEGYERKKGDTRELRL